MVLSIEEKADVVRFCNNQMGLRKLTAYCTQATTSKSILSLARFDVRRLSTVCAESPETFGRTALECLCESSGGTARRWNAKLVQLVQPEFAWSSVRWVEWRQTRSYLPSTFACDHSTSLFVSWVRSHVDDARAIAHRLVSASVTHQLSFLSWMALT
jgi:hypothetical protein